MVLWETNSVKFKMHDVNGQLSYDNAYDCDFDVILPMLWAALGVPCQTTRHRNPATMHFLDISISTIVVPYQPLGHNDRFT